MTQLAQSLWRACADLGLRIELDFKLVLPNVPQLTAVARIWNLGSPNGMLIFTNYEEIRYRTKDILEAGYGYAILAEPATCEVFDLESFVDMFRDWGWSGDIGCKPTWMH